MPLSAIFQLYRGIGQNDVVVSRTWEHNKIVSLNFNSNAHQ